MEFKNFCDLCAKAESVSTRKDGLLYSVFKSYYSDISTVIDLLTGKPETGLSYKSLSNLLYDYYGLDRATSNDPIEIIRRHHSGQSTGLSLKQVYISLGERGGLLDLLDKTDTLEATWLAKTVLGRFGGLGEMTILGGLSLLYGVSKDKLKRFYNESPDFSHIINAYIEKGPGAFNHSGLILGSPVRPLLCTAVKELPEEEYLCEWKYDGERCQVHCTKTGVVIYSRTGEVATERFKDVALGLEGLDQEMILDCEIVAWAGSRVLPFQVLSLRKRKSTDTTIGVRAMAFDLLYLDRPLIGEPIEIRKNLLEGLSLPEIVQVVKYKTTPLSLPLAMQEAVSNDCEGLVFKKKGESYEAGGRTWLKIKKEYMASHGDSFDLIIIGANLGRGKRKDVYGSFLLATRELETVCKLGTGLSEGDLQSLYQQLSQEVITKEGPMDVYFDPRVVVEVKASDITSSPTYTCASSLFERGLSLRFPRLVRYRPDKTPAEATSSKTIYDLFMKCYYKK